MDNLNDVYKKIYKTGLVVTLSFFLLFLFYKLRPLDNVYKRNLSEHYIAEGVQETGAINLVASVLYDYRAFDTLGEATVILTAAAILAFLVPIKAAKPRNSFTIIVKSNVVWLTPFLAVLGAYLILFGHISPGGSFAGGVVLAIVPILLTVGYGVEFSEYKIKSDDKKLTEAIGAISFILLGLLGVWTGNHFLSSGQANLGTGKTGELVSAGLIPFLNIIIGIKIGAGMAILFNSLIKDKK